MSQALLRSNKEGRLSSSNVTPVENFETLYIRSFFAPLVADDELPLGCLVLSAIQLFTYGSSANSLRVKEKTAKIKKENKGKKGIFSSFVYSFMLMDILVADRNKERKVTHFIVGLC